MNSGQWTDPLCNLCGVRVIACAWLGGGARNARVEKNDTESTFRLHCGAEAITGYSVVSRSASAPLRTRLSINVRKASIGAQRMRRNNS